MHLLDNSSISITERDIRVEEQQESIESVSASTKTDKCQQEVTVTANQCSNNSIMTDAIPPSL